MFKTVSAVIALVCAFPLLAHSWTFNTQAKNVGGTITSRNMVNQTSVSGSLFKSYTTHAPLTVAVAANTGYGISNVTVNGMITNTPPSPYTISVQGMTTQTVFATFSPAMVSVTASASVGGTVSPTSVLNRYYGTKLTSALVFTFTPVSGNRLISLTGAAGASVNSALPAATNASVTVTYPVGYTFTNPIALLGTFNGPPVANAGTPQTVLLGSLVTLMGSYTGGSGILPTYTWTQLSGPSVALASNGNQASFTAHLLGIYLFTVTLDTGSSATTRVTATDSLAVAARNECQSCHTSNGIGTAQVFSNWSSSMHKARLVICATCHVGNNSGSHPGTLTSGKVSETTFNYTTDGASFCVTCHSSQVITEYSASRHNAVALTCSICHTTGVHNPAANANCNGCHLDELGNVPLHPLPIGDATCVSCHNPHTGLSFSTSETAVHYNNVTSAMYPASYNTSRSTCFDCHAVGTYNMLMRKQWEGSGHANVTSAAWVSYDFKTKPGCVQCHTKTGFIAYSTGKMTAAWGTASDKSKEVLTCIACHSDVATGTQRVVSPISPFADDAYVNHNVGRSNLCMNCHSGTNNGNSVSVKVGVADFTNLPFIAPHFMAAGATLQGKAGYHFPGQTYASYSSNSHREIGMENKANTGSAGPCVVCHMTNTMKHNYEAVTHDRTGTITGLVSVICINCHAGSLGVTQINADRTAFLNIMSVLKAMLAAKGFVYTNSSPYFSTTNWGVGQSGANTMGAAYNYVMLLNDTGAYAHNSAYAKQLVLDSIDYLDNGQLDDSVATLAVPSLLASGAITQAVADSFISYKPNKDTCLSCHGGTATSANPISTGAHPAHLSGVYGTASFFGSGASSCQSCHNTSSAVHLNGIIDLVIGAGSACQGCHPGAAPAWGSSARLDCTVCHAATPAVLPNGVAAPYKANFASTGHGKYPASNQCTTCHDPDSSHISGSLGTHTRLRLLNDNNQCASCHNNALIVGPSFLNMSTHIKKDGTPLGCNECHDAHGTLNLGMIRTVISGSAIVVRDDVNGLVDQVTNRGLCQVCHTLTKYYIAGVPETVHFASRCLNCHPHNNAFRPVSDGSCDSCHGYPPAPRVSAATFGTVGNWENGRFEDYSGGGGAHLVAAHISPNAKPSEKWANCSVCHNRGIVDSTPYHTMTLPLASHVNNVTVAVDTKYRFDNSFTIYSGAKLVNPPAHNVTGSCSNISCHMSPSPRWSIER